MTRPLAVVNRGVEGLGEPFQETLAFQQALLERKAAHPEESDAIIFVEHDHVYTVGRGTPQQPGVAGVPWVEISRGGQATYHGPGQLVCYPIFDLNAHGKDVHVFLRKLEDVIIFALRDLGVYSYRREGLTGVWVEGSDGTSKKVASIGVGVSRWISYHGLALNVTTDLNYFRAISPCGQEGEVMTTLAEIRPDRIPTMDEVKEALESSFRTVFQFEGAAEEGPIKPFPKPKWLKVRAPGSPEFLETRKIVKDLKLVTVCEEARCPNMGECWSHRTATFMVMGEFCTRRCSFCSVKDGTVENLSPLDPLEPYRVGKAVAELGLKHVVITSVDRDDVPDMGADHFDRTVRQIQKQNPECRIELLIPDMRGKKPLVEMILQSKLVSVLNHNVETVPRLYRRVRPGANFERSLNVLRWAKEFQPTLKTKSGLMVGVGEKREEILEVLDRLREVGVDIVTIGQYLQPSKKQLPVDRFVPPEEFQDYYEEGVKRGFSFVESGPLVRSSYHAWKHTNDRGLVVPFDSTGSVVVGGAHP